jgi:hypothetical protein
MINKRDYIDVLFNRDQGIAVEIFLRNDAKLPFGVRMVDLDSGSTLPTIRFCPSLDLAKTYAHKLIGF